MDREQARQYRERWKLVSDFVAEEARRTPASVKLRQLALMYEAARALGWAGPLKDGEDEVRERWRRLKEKRHV